MEDHINSSGDAKSMKSNLKGWREVFVVVSKLTKWEKPYYPGIVFGIISGIFTMVWYIDPSLITGVSMVMMIICLLDYLIPFISPIVFPETNWNSDKEKEFTNGCAALSSARTSAKKSMASLFKLKDTNPWLYVAISTVSLSTLAWLGNQMHNLMLAYFITLVAASIPGLAHHGLLKQGMDAVGRLGKKKSN